MRQIQALGPGASGGLVTEQGEQRKAGSRPLRELTQEALRQSERFKRAFPKAARLRRELENLIPDIPRFHRDLVDAERLLRMLSVDLHKAIADQQPSLVIEIVRTISDTIDNVEGILTGPVGRMRQASRHRSTSVPALIGQLGSALELTHEIIAVADAAASETSAMERAAAIRSATPEQQTGPVQFMVVDGIVHVQPSEDRAAKDDAAGADEAREGLLVSGAALIEELRSSNCDRRLVGSIEALQAKLQSRQDIIQLGILNIACENMRATFEAELPDAIAAMLKTQAIGISLYLGQFPQWSRFVDNAAAVEMAPADITVIHAAASEAATAMKGSDFVDPEVPRLIKLLMRAIENPKGEAKRAAFAVLRTIENLVAAIYKYGADFVVDAAARTRTRAAKAISAAVVAAMLTMAAQAAGGVGPIAGRIMGSEWMQSVAKIVERQIEDLTKT